jgi:hypothetical protein
MREVIIDGAQLKRLPGSDYWIGPDGTTFKVVQLVPNSRGQYHINKNGKRTHRSRSRLASLYDKLK